MISRVLTGLLFLLLLGCTKNSEGVYKEEVASAVGYFNNGQYDQAIQALKGLESKYPDRAEVQFLLSGVESRRGIYDDKGNLRKHADAKESLAHLAKAVSLKPDNSLYGLTYAGLLADLGRCNEAIPFFDKHYNSLARYRWKSAKIIYVRYAQCLVDSGSQEEALSIISDLERIGSLDESISKEVAAVKERAR